MNIAIAIGCLLVMPLLGLGIYKNLGEQRQMIYCDFCGNEATVDGKTTLGPWANMCDECAKKHGTCLRTRLAKETKYIQIGTAPMKNFKGEDLQPVPTYVRVDDVAGVNYEAKTQEPMISKDKLVKELNALKQKCFGTMGFYNTIVEKVLEIAEQMAYE
jgi:hypothetical protein